MVQAWTVQLLPLVKIIDYSQGRLAIVFVLFTACTFISSTFKIAEQFFEMVNSKYSYPCYEDWHPIKVAQVFTVAGKQYKKSTLYKKRTCWNKTVADSA